MAEQDVHQRGLAGAVLAEQREDFAAPQLEIDRVIGDKAPKRLPMPASFRTSGWVSADKGSRRHLDAYDDFGSASLMLTRNMPSVISFSFSLTSFTTSAGTSFSSITRLAPLCAMKLNGP